MVDLLFWVFLYIDPRWRHGGDTGVGSMAVARLSKRVIDSVASRDRTYILYDSDLPGFGLRVMPSGVKTWIVEYRPGGGGRGVSKRRLKIDAATKISPAEARSRAMRILAGVRLGDDPAGARAADRSVPTVAEFAERFLKEVVGS